MNPELKRNILIEITAQRLLAMPLILGLIFAAARALENITGLIMATEVMFWLLVFLWGTRKAAGAFDAELATWTYEPLNETSRVAAEIARRLPAVRADAA